MKKQERPYLRHIKYREKVGGKLPVPSVIDVHVVGSGARGAPRSLLLTTNHSKYLFNCGEGTQRIASEFRMRLSKLENIFITHKSWDNIGGLLGMGLTLQVMKVPRLLIHGPPGVESVIMMAKGFAESPNIVLEKKELDNGTFTDTSLQIDYVPFYKKGFNPEKRCLNQDEKAVEDSQVKKKQKLVSEENAVAVAYICKPFPTQRKIILEKCVDLGVEVGPLFAKLKNGESVTLQNGSVVHPDQVLSDPETPSPILIVECPSEDYLDSMLASPQLETHQNCSDTDLNKPALIVHMTPLQVYKREEYQSWMKKFGPNVHHLVLNELTSEIMLEGVYRYQTQLNLVHSTIFPTLAHHPHSSQSEQVQSNDMPAETGAGCETTSVVMGCTNLRYQYRPKKEFVWDQCIRLDPEAYIAEALAQTDVKEVLDDLQQELKAMHSSIQQAKSNSHRAGMYPRFVFLGTGSSVPSKGRNVSGLVVHLSDDATVILDCGEGTSGQLYRHYGNEAGHVLRTLKAVFVSHLHADHHMGLFSLLRDRQAALDASKQEMTPTLLLAPIQLARWLRFYDEHVEPIKSLFRHIPLQYVLSHMLELPVNANMYADILKELSLSEFVPVEVEHCPNAFGLSMVHKDGWKLVFSGDTIPCERLVNAGKDCDILVHEATHEDNLEEEAHQKRHSTTSQAIDIGQRMGAKFILLNHFSQRYAKIPVFNDLQSTNVGIAFDNMSVSMCELPLLPLFIPALKALFAEEHADLEAISIKRNRRKELQEKLSAQIRS
ncbi:hypothetical protein C0Q70_00744 [Pomacea canaliculata]|uniref:Zinc phosphodiesterase ELAC protein 2 n=2 Tax=Pomacea canaliculata TaxID=400727 RepID=A0A2T7PXH6_POMCA|nr:hypothetical protein C0Q70_00744 [Pomacea canaliculata]